MAGVKEELTELCQKKIAQSNEHILEQIGAVFAAYRVPVEEIKATLAQKVQPETTWVEASVTLEMDAIMNKGHKIYISVHNNPYYVECIPLSTPFSKKDVERLQYIFMHHISEYSRIHSELFAAFSDSIITPSIDEKTGNITFTIGYNIGNLLHGLAVKV